MKRTYLKTPRGPRCARQARQRLAKEDEENDCRFTTYRHRFARVAPAPRAKLIDSKNRGRASPVKKMSEAKGRARRSREVDLEKEDLPAD